MDVPRSYRPAVSLVMAIVAVVGLTFAAWGKIQQAAAQEAEHVRNELAPRLDSIDRKLDRILERLLRRP